MEIHGDGYRCGTQGDPSLPYVFEKLIDCLTQGRLARQEEASRSVSEHLTGVADDLTRALIANPVFRHTVATHDLLSYAMKEPGKYLAVITTEQLHHGDTVAPDSLTPAAAANVLAIGLPDFVDNHSLAVAMQEMTSKPIQAIALFLNDLPRKPPKRIHISERADLAQGKATYTPAGAVASPQVLSLPMRLSRVRTSCVSVYVR
jgi:hypothetical protein